MNVLDVQGLRVEYRSDGRGVVGADDVSFTIGAGEIFGLAGESGCGKSTVANAVMRLLRPPAEITAGSVTFKGRDVLAMDARELRAFRWREISMVFQSAMNSSTPSSPSANRSATSSPPTRSCASAPPATARRNSSTSSASPPTG